LKTKPDDTTALFALSLSVGIEPDYASLIEIFDFRAQQDNGEVLATAALSDKRHFVTGRSAACTAVWLWDVPGCRALRTAWLGTTFTVYREGHDGN